MSRLGLSWEQRHFNGHLIRPRILKQKRARKQMTAKPSNTAESNSAQITEEALLVQKPTHEVTDSSEERQSTEPDGTLHLVNRTTVFKPKKKEIVPLWRRPPQQIVKKRESVAPQRPSFQDQLNSITTIACSVTSDLRNQFLGNSIASITTDNRQTSAGYLFTVPSTNFVVGKLTARFPTPVRFYEERCEYEFHHPFQATEILMVMYYQDMSECKVTSRQLQFKIPHNLFHYGNDYDWGNRHHFVGICFASDLDTRRIAQHLRNVGLLTRGVRMKRES